MFIKPFKIKSNVRLRNTDRKRLRSQLESQYPHLSASQLDELCPVGRGGELFQLRLLCHGGESVVAYSLDSEPLFFEQDGGRLVPSLYTLWRLPSLLPYVCTWKPVVERLAGGADFMAPGLAGYSERLSEARLGDAVAVRVAGAGRAAVAVGHLLQSPKALVAEQRAGKAVAITHVLGDQLWVHGGKRPLPQIDGDSCGEEEDEENQQPESQETDSQAVVPEENSSAVDEEQCAPAEKPATAEVQPEPTEDAKEEQQVEETTDTMDALLESCVLSALRSKLPLPLLASSLYSGHVLPRCPPGRQLDIRRTSYKKLSTYLAHLQSEGLLALKETSPGVQSIVSVRREHPRLRGFAQMELPPAEPPKGDGYRFPTIRELRSITAAVLPLFPGRSKGHTLGLDEVRAVIRSYVKENELQDPDDKSSVKMDPRLSDAAACSSEKLSWEELFSRVMSRMQPAHEVTPADGGRPTVHRGALPPISFTVAQRTGNKKVTLVEGLESYGIDVANLAHEVQVGVAASVSVTPLANGKQQVLVQGNQVAFMERLLTGPSYGVPRKYLKGLEHAAGKKKGGARK
uniref:Translation initiation factor 2D n=1 Tax=Rhipicephalus zambeziensis TaxID=60191 RepID=A0A224Z3V1_9ACAR